MITAALVLSAAMLNPAVTQANIAQTICVAGWTRTVRPPTSYTNRVKRGLMAKAGLSWTQARAYELDHRVPLELGGAPRDPSNLWLQPWNGPTGAHAKDTAERRVNRLVCAGLLPLASARQCMAHDWMTCP